MKPASMPNEAGFIGNRSKLHLPSKLYSFFTLKDMSINENEWRPILWIAIRINLISWLRIRISMQYGG